MVADTLPMLERRRIEATILKHVYETLKESHGAEVATRAVADAVRRAAIEQARQLAAAEPGGKTSMRTFIDRQAQWRMGDALTTETLHESDTRFDFNVTRCRYAEMYREMGLGEIGHLLSCQRDGTFCEGYDPRLKMTRTQTIMQGASHCDFRYRWIEGEGG
ncbi:MAG: L-2-amino-thiazoline-4-carboxylic acid hydrolase [Hyphomicrobiaceae bacterium]